MRDWPACFAKTMHRFWIEDFLAYACTKEEGPPLRAVGTHACNGLTEEDLLNHLRDPNVGPQLLENSLETYLPFVNCTVTAEKWQPYRSVRIEQWVEEKLVQQQRERLGQSVESQGRAGVVRKM